MVLGWLLVDLIISSKAQAILKTQFREPSKFFGRKFLALKEWFSFNQILEHCSIYT